MNNYKFYSCFLVLILTVTISNFSVADTTMVEHVVPQFIGSKTASGTNNARTPFAVCLQITGLLPNTAYDVQIGVGLTTDAATVFGAGNVWNRNRNSFSNQLDTLAFVTNSSGDSGPFWSFIQPTGNASRFNAGQVHNLRVGYAITGGSISGNPAFIGTKQFTALDIAATARTPETTDDGAFIKGFGFGNDIGKFALIYNNEAGTGNPMYSSQIRTTTFTNTNQSELPVSINDVFRQSGTSVIGDFAAVIPIGANNAAGVRRVEIRNSDNTIAYALTDNNGIWMNGTNTTNIIRRDAGLLNYFSRLNLTVLIEGFYSSGSNSMISDTVKVVMRNFVSPYAPVDSAISVLSSSANGEFAFANVSNATPYYIVFKHRNTVETWSASGNIFTSGVMSYDFTTASSNAYGSNMIQVDASPVEFAAFSGDVNQDGIIDGSDSQLIDNDAFNFTSGYVNTDVNGDQIVDGSDASITGNNSDNFVAVARP